MVVEVSSAEELVRHVMADGAPPVAIVDVYASWCGPCMRFAPRFAELASYNRDLAVWIKVDGDKHRDIAGAFQVSAFPTFVVLKAGQPVGTIRGANEGEILRTAGTALGRALRTMPPPKAGPATFLTFPLRSPTTVDVMDTTKAFSILETKAGSVPEGSGALSGKELEALRGLRDVLADSTRYHAATIPPQIPAVLFTKLTAWPLVSRAVALDIVRKSIRLAPVYGKLADSFPVAGTGPSAVGGAAAGGGGSSDTSGGGGSATKPGALVVYESIVESLTSKDAPKGLVVIAGRTLLNLTATPAGAIVVRHHASQVCSTLVPALLASGHPSGVIVASAVLGNLSHLVFRGHWPGSDPCDLTDDLLDLAGEVLAASTSALTRLAKADDPLRSVVKDVDLDQTRLNLLVAIGTVLCGGEMALMLGQTSDSLGSTLDALAADASTSSGASGKVGGTIADIRAVLGGTPTISTPKT